MSELQHNEIIYEEGWRDASPRAEIETDDVPLDEQPAAEEEKKPVSRPLLISIQLVLCLLAVLVLFVLRSMDSEVYRSFMGFYRDELNRPLISRGVFDTLDISRLFDPELFTVTESDNELPHR